MALKATLQFKNKTKEVEGGIAEVVDRAVRRSVKLMERNVKVATPVKEGTLRRSIQSRSTGFGKGEVFNQSVEGGRETLYAIFVEFGTRFMAPRAMFRKGVSNSEDGIKQIFTEEGRKVHNKMR